MVPNVIIGGAPKCATTSLFAWLSDHPEVNASKYKETFYLLDKDCWKFNPDFNYFKNGLEGYKKFFNPAKHNEKIILEGTTLYIYQDIAIEVVKQIGAKMIFVLRNPTERAYSNFKYFFNNRAGDKNISQMSFPEFVDRLFDKGTSFDNQQIDETLINGVYVKYLEKWEAAIGRENIKIVLLEDIMADTTSVAKDISLWLGIDPHFYKNYNFVSENQSVKIKNYFFHNVTRWIARILTDSKFKRKLRKIYKSLNTIQISRQESEASRLAFLRLNEFYKLENKKLAKKFNLDLSSWE